MQTELSERNRKRFNTNSPSRALIARAEVVSSSLSEKLMASWRLRALATFLKLYPGEQLVNRCSSDSEDLCGARLVAANPL
jgi:hypothetical protein